MLEHRNDFALVGIIAPNSLGFDPIYKNEKTGEYVVDNEDSGTLTLIGELSASKNVTTLDNSESLEKYIIERAQYGLIGAIVLEDAKIIAFLQAKAMGEIGYTEMEMFKTPFVPNELTKIYLDTDYELND